MQDLSTQKPLTFRVSARSIAGPIEEAVSLADARLWLRQDVPGFSGDTGQDGTLMSIIRGARQACEHEIDKAIGVQTILAAAPGFSQSFYPWHSWYLPGQSPYRNTPDPLPLPLGPVRTITSIQYRDPDTNAYVTLPTTVYEQDAFTGAVVLAPGQSWPMTKIANDAVLVTYIAGLTLPTESESTYERLGEDVIQALRMTIAHFWFNRSSVVQAAGRQSILEVPLGVKALLWANRSSIGI